MSRSSSGTTHLSDSTQATSLVQDTSILDTYGLPPIVSKAVELEATRNNVHLPQDDPLMQQFRQLEHNLADLNLTMWASTYDHDDAVSDDTRPQLSSIRIAPVIQRRAYPDPAIRTMPSSDIKNLTFGYLVNLYIDVQPIRVKLTETKYSIKALCAISPIIKAAVNANGSHSCLDDIALPPGSASAYLKILEWLDDIIRLGRIVPLHEKTSAPLVSFYEIRAIAHALQIKPLWGNINNRYEGMVTFVPGQTWTVSLEDIREAFSREELGSTTLTSDLISNLARVWTRGGVSKSKMKQIEDLTYEIEELWEDLERKLSEMGWKDESGVVKGPS